MHRKESDVTLHLLHRMKGFAWLPCKTLRLQIDYCTYQPRSSAAGNGKGYSMDSYSPFFSLPLSAADFKLVTINTYHQIFNSQTSWYYDMYSPNPPNNEETSSKAYSNNSQTLTQTSYWVPPFVSNVQSLGTCYVSSFKCSMHTHKTEIIFTEPNVNTSCLRRNLST
jgi:hypothetical protein